MSEDSESCVRGGTVQHLRGHRHAGSEESLEGDRHEPLLETMLVPTVTTQLRSQDRFLASNFTRFCRGRYTPWGKAGLLLPPALHRSGHMVQQEPPYGVLWLMFTLCTPYPHQPIVSTCTSPPRHALTWVTLTDRPLWIVFGSYPSRSSCVQEARRAEYVWSRCPDRHTSSLGVSRWRAVGKTSGERGIGVSSPAVSGTPVASIRHQEEAFHDAVFSDNSRVVTAAQA